MKILHVFTLPGTAEAFFDGQFGYLSRCGHKITVAGGGDRFPDKEDFVKGTPFCHAACMVRREAYDTVGGYSVDTRLLRVEDYHLWFKMYACGYKGYVMTVPLYKMRDDCNAVLRRIWRNRWNELYVRRLGYAMLHIPLYKRIWMLQPLHVCRSFTQEALSEIA